MRIAAISILPLAAVLTLSACRGTPEAGHAQAPPDAPDGAPLVLRDTVIDAFIEIAGTAEPMAHAQLSTRLMGTVTEVLVREGDLVAAGQPLVRVDARELDARRAQVAAQLAAAEAMEAEARLTAERFRRLYADSVATRAQLDAVETGLARAGAAVQGARAGAAEVEAMGGYAEVRAPFAGLVSGRLVDPGDFAAPGTPLVTIEDVSRLRLSASLAPAAARGLRRGQRLHARIEDRAAVAVIEGVVPAGAGALYTVNAIVNDAAREHLAHGAVTLLVPAGRHSALVVPARAVERDGDLARVIRLRGGRPERRLVRLGAAVGDGVEVLSGLAAGDTVLVPARGGD